MTPEQLKANLDRFNEASTGAQEGLGRVKRWLESHEPDPELTSGLELYMASVSVMIETSSDLIGITGPLSPGAEK